MRPPEFQPGSFEYIEAKIRRDAEGTAFGGDFEWLCQWFLENAPRYRGQFDKVWLWKDWPEKWGSDAGIDIVARTRSGELWAIQAKADHPDRSIAKREIDSFLSESNRPEFDYRLLMATTDDIGKTARRTLHGQQKPVGLVLRGHFLTEEVQWPIQIRGTAVSLPRWNARPHQATAIEAVVNGFRDHDRGQLIMACGTGKTLTALWIAERLQSSLTLVLVPSLSLVQQNLAEWGRHAAADFDALVVCSDESVLQSNSDTAIQSTADLGVKVTTSAAEIRRFLGQRRKRPAVVFATYQSSDRIAAAQVGKSKPFDLAICDEAHRLAGHAAGLFATVLDAKKIKARQRLFMTATPRYFKEHLKRRAAELEFELVSMDDQHVFGPEFHVLTFHEAISAKPEPLLTDYQVVVIGVTDREAKAWAEEARFVRTADGLSTDARTLAAQIGLAKAMKKYDLRKIITFHSSVAKAARFVDATQRDSLPGVIPHLTRSARPAGQLWTKHVSGHTPAGQRATLLKGLGNLPDDTRGILSNCACLGEGVDVPVLDGVAFIDPKRSMVDIIQAVGRVIRKAAGKQIGTIVIPVFIDETEDADHVLSQSAFEPVWQVLKALRAHDRRLADELDQLRLSLGKRSKSRGRIKLSANIHLDVPRLLLPDFEQAFYVRTVEQTTDKPKLTIEQILAWADAHNAMTGDWPNIDSGQVFGTNEKWSSISAALSTAVRGLPGGSSLAKLLAEHRDVRNHMELATLTYASILTWADAHYQRTGKWPRVTSGQIEESPGETWRNIQTSLNQGLRGLPSGYSLAKLLADERHVRNRRDLATLSEKQVLAWVDAHYEQTGRWPGKDSGPIHDALGETWASVNRSLYNGSRGLPGGSSLAQLLADTQRKPNHMALPPLTTERILEWADSHYQRTGQWPNQKTGTVGDAPNESWTAINTSLSHGIRGLPGGSSLMMLLAEHRGLKSKHGQPSLTIERILTWADAHFARTGNWPTRTSGPVADAPDENWIRIDGALVEGLRGLSAGSSLGKLLAEHRNVRGRTRSVPPLTVEQILVWADKHREKTGHWPKQDSGAVHDAPGETWKAVHMALLKGSRGLPGGSSIVKLLGAHRGLKSKHGRPPLTIEQILAWADAHHERTGEWPKSKSIGPIRESPDETWQTVAAALGAGSRGLPSGTSLAKVLAQGRGVRNKQALPRLTVSQILKWADAHKTITDDWPRSTSGMVAGTQETWAGINVALVMSLRGLPGVSSLAKLLSEHRGVRNLHDLPPLTNEQILVWADEYHLATGKWPNERSGGIAETGETWAGINASLRKGNRGLPGSSSLVKLLDQRNMQCTT